MTDAHHPAQHPLSLHPCPSTTYIPHKHIFTPPPSSGWWFKPDFIINELNINSAVSKPWHDEVLPLATNNMYPMSGYAYTGMGREARVLRGC